VNKKRAAFALFDQGKVTSSPEVKALKLKSQTRSNYFYEWRMGGKGQSQMSKEQSQTGKGSQPLPGGEAIGGIDETKKVIKEAATIKPESQQKPEEAEEPGDEEQDKGKEGRKPEEAPPEKPPPKEETIGIVSEVPPPPGKDGKPVEPGRKIATTISEDGIQCKVFLSLQTLSLYRIAASTQAQFDGEGELTLGDFLDTCAEDFFRVRGKKLGLIRVGGK